jgi:hypothetical protein
MDAPIRELHLTDRDEAKEATAKTDNEAPNRPKVLTANDEPRLE